MKTFSVRRIGQGLLHILLSLFVLLCATFVIGRLLPSDPAGILAGDMADPTAYAAVRARLGLDQPIYVQFGRYVADLLRGNLGQALLTGNPVSKDLAQVVPATFGLATFAIIISTLVGVPLGLLAALYRDSWFDKAVRLLVLLGSSIPVFWLGIVGLIVFYARLSWVGGPGQVDVFFEGMVEPRTGILLLDSLLANETEIFWNALSHILLPASILGYVAMAYICRMTRSFTLEQVGQDYVIAARAKGASATRTLFRHIVPNIAVQLITVIALSYGGLLEGTVVAEVVFSWPGIGQYMTNALMSGDMNAVLACTLVIGTAFMLLNFLADSAYALLDPRLREAR